MASDSISLRSALAVGITSSALFAGLNLSLGYVSIPSLLSTSALAPVPSNIILSQWQLHYNIAKGYGLSLVASTLLGYGYSAWATRRPAARQLLLWGIVGAVAAPVYSVVFMEGALGDTNGEIARMNVLVNGRAEPGAMSAAEVQSVRELCERWAVLVTIRAVPMVLSGLAGIWASFVS